MLHEVLSFVKRHKERPFFLYWPTPIAHVPLQAPQRWIDYYVKNSVTSPLIWVTKDTSLVAIQKLHTLPWLVIWMSKSAVWLNY